MTIVRTLEIQRQRRPYRIILSMRRTRRCKVPSTRTPVDLTPPDDSSDDDSDEQHEVREIQIPRSVTVKTTGAQSASKDPKSGLQQRNMRAKVEEVEDE